MGKFDYMSAAIEFRVDCPDPESDAGKLLVCAHNARLRAAALETDNLRLLAEIDELKIEIERLKTGGEK